MTGSDMAFGSSALSVLADMVAELDRSVPGWLESIGDDATATVLLLDDIRSVRMALARIEAGVESQAARAMTGGKLLLPDGRLAERRGGWTYTQWDDARVAGRVALMAVGGDLDAAPFAYQTRDAILGAAAVRWRLTALRDLGVEFEDACVRERGRRTVQVSAPREQKAVEQ